MGEEGEGRQNEERQMSCRSEMAGWLTNRLVPSVADCASVLQKTAKNFMQLKHVSGNADMNE